MSRPRDPFAHALDDLRGRLAEGRFPAGRPIVIADEARTLQLSTTPVREALCWLGGEGLIERGGAGGFVAPRLDASLVAQRYALRRLYLMQTQGHAVEPPPSGLIVEAAPADRLRATWRWRVRAIGDAALADAYDRLQGHLARFRAAEARLFADLDAEAETLLADAGGGSSEAITGYHARRVSAAPMIAVSAESDSPEARS